MSEDVVETMRRHDHSEVVVFGGRPPCFPVGPRVVAFALEELTSTLLRRSVEQDPTVKDVVELGSSAVGASRMTMSADVIDIGVDRSGMRSEFQSGDSQSNTCQLVFPRRRRSSRTRRWRRQSITRSAFSAGDRWSQHSAVPPA